MPLTAAEEAAKVSRLVAEKEAQMIARGRCAGCWHNARDGHCICERVGRVRPTRDVRVLVYAHHKEYYSAGDDAKLLPLAMPEHARVFVHGRRGDDEALLAELRGARGRACLLFPDDAALSVAAATAPEGPLAAFAPDSASEGPLIVVVVDATWQLARRLARHLDRLGAELPHVALETELVSVYARTQSQTGRVCTVEAVALFLREIGESNGPARSEGPIRACARLPRRASRRSPRFRELATRR